MSHVHLFSICQKNAGTFPFENSMLRRCPLLNNKNQCHFQYECTKLINFRNYSLIHDNIFINPK